MDIDELSAALRSYVVSDLAAPLAWPWLDDVLAQWFTRHKQTWHATTDVLPCLTCGAAGGTAEQAVPLAGFWSLYFFASKLFDSVQDGDELDQPWLAHGSADAISLGLALIASGNASLAGITDVAAIADISRAFGRTWALAAKSQTEPQNALTLEAYFANVIASTAQPIATACWAGARLATDDAQVLRDFNEYGLNLGIRLAIMSDCAGLRPDAADKPSDVAAGIYKLPVIYAASIGDHPRHEELMALLSGEPLSCAQTEQVLAIVAETQAVAWSMGVAEQYRRRAIAALEGYTSPAVERLIAYAS